MSPNAVLVVILASYLMIVRSRNIIPILAQNEEEIQENAGAANVTLLTAEIEEIEALIRKYPNICPNS